MNSYMTELSDLNFYKICRYTGSSNLENPNEIMEALREDICRSQSRCGDCYLWPECCPKRNPYNDQGNRYLYNPEKYEQIKKRHEEEWKRKLLERERLKVMEERYADYPEMLDKYRKYIWFNKIVNASELPETEIHIARFYYLYSDDIVEKVKEKRLVDYRNEKVFRGGGKYKVHLYVDLDEVNKYADEICYYIWEKYKPLDPYSTRNNVYSIFNHYKSEWINATNAYIPDEVISEGIARLKMKWKKNLIENEIPKALRKHHMILTSKAIREKREENRKKAAEKWAKMTPKERRETRKFQKDLVTLFFGKVKKPVWLINGYITLIIVMLVSVIFKGGLACWPFEIILFLMWRKSEIDRYN